MKVSRLRTLRPSLVFFNILLGVLAFMSNVALADGNDKQQIEKQTDQQPVVYLHTEWEPFVKQSRKSRQKTGKPSKMDRLTRELVRQALLVTLTHEFGLPVRDRTLWESSPGSTNVIHLAALTRRGSDGKWKVKLHRIVPDPDEEFMFSIDSKLWLKDAMWEKTYQYTPAVGKIYSSGAQVMEAASRADFVDALEQLGVQKQKIERVQGTVADAQLAQWNEQLAEVNFIAQFNVLRQVHQAIKKYGQSPQLLGLLTRGYAQLGLLTSHSVNSSTDVFVARSMVYAHRMMALTGDNDLSLWHHACAFGLAGVQNAAIGSLEKIAQRASDEDGTKAENEAQDEDEAQDENENSEPEWAVLLKAYLDWDRDALFDLASDDPWSRDWAWRLYFLIVDDLRYEEDVHRAYALVRDEIPCAWGVYARVHRYGSLKAMRSSAFKSLEAWEYALPVSVQGIADLPSQTSAVLTDQSDAEDLLARDQPPGDAEKDEDPFSLKLTRSLRLESGEDWSPALSWSVLASMIEDEQFLQVYRCMQTLTNATQSDLTPYIDRFLPTVKKHRFGPFVEAYKHFYDADDRKKYRETIQKVTYIPDARRNMQSMLQTFRAAWRQKIKGAIILSYYNYTGRSLMEHLFHSSPLFRFTLSKGRRNKSEDVAAAKPQSAIGTIFFSTNKNWGTKMSAALNTLFPNSVIGPRVKAQFTRSASLAKLKDWEEVLAQDPAGLTALSQQYFNRNDTDNGIRLLESSISQRPSRNGSKSLADLHYQRKDYPAWEQVWLDYLKSSTSVMDRSVAAQTLITGYSDLGRWAKAEPFVETAAEVWSAGGLKVASVATEQLCDWDASERWIKALSSSYSSSAGWLWYFWCRRTGRGDLEGARELAAQHLRGDQKYSSRGPYTLQGAYDFIEGDFESALKAYENALDFFPSLSCTHMVGRIARELGDNDRAEEVVREYQRHLEGLEELSPIDQFGSAMVPLMKSDKLNPADLATVKARLEKLPPLDASMGSCCVGAELLRLGQKDRAKEYFRNSIRCQTRDLVYSTLAGHELAQMDGVSRSTDDQRTPETTWLLPKESE